ncbi:MAG: hypothetical protein JWN41_1522 [Thermoleophilia bacterium]|nr:hypothetical protein [Thermoleophilia bacterium]
MHTAPTTEHELSVVDLLTDGAPALLGASPLAAEIYASSLCIGWYLTAPRPAGDRLDHPYGTSPAVPVLRMLMEQVDTYPHQYDSALALTRVLASLDPESEMLNRLAARHDAELTGRGARGPSWSRELDQWELIEAWELRETTDPCGMLYALTGWRHPNGDEHALGVFFDARQSSNLLGLHLDRNIADSVAELRRDATTLVPHAPFIFEPASGHSVAARFEQGRRTSYVNDIEPIRNDIATLELYALAEARFDALVRRQLCELARA